MSILACLPGMITAFLCARWAVRWARSTFGTHIAVTVIAACLGWFFCPVIAAVAVLRWFSRRAVVVHRV